MMRLLLLAPAALGMLIGGSAYAPAASPATTVASTPPSQCFLPDRITNFRSSRNAKLYVRTLDRKVFELETSGACFDLDAANRLAISSFIGSSRLCIGDTANIAGVGSAATAGQVQRCRAEVSRVLTAEEIDALPRNARP